VPARYSARQGIDGAQRPCYRVVTRQQAARTGVRRRKSRSVKSTTHMAAVTAALARATGAAEERANAEAALRDRHGAASRRSGGRQRQYAAPASRCYACGSLCGEKNQNHSPIRRHMPCIWRSAATVIMEMSRYAWQRCSVTQQRAACCSMLAARSWQYARQEKIHVRVADAAYLRSISYETRILPPVYHAFC